MFGFKMPSGMSGSPMSMMNNQQKLQALGSAFSGDQKGLASIMSQLGGQGRAGPPVMNQDGQDISAAFGGQLGPRHGGRRFEAPEEEEPAQGGQGGGMGGLGDILASGGLLTQMPMGLLPSLMGRKGGFGFGGR